ncbi:unnamed protein product [Adineta ricciae]|uniref:Uncharacterized protein n=1 Tax=Adineta ricciae TaxID=249248 RepID=A0A815EZ33_ADIRI|nr:unnamed protein product [Adineta ricciae]
MRSTYLKTTRRRLNTLELCIDRRSINKISSYSSNQARVFINNNDSYESIVSIEKQPSICIIFERKRSK